MVINGGKYYVSPKVRSGFSLVYGKGLFVCENIRARELIVDYSTSPFKTISCDEAFELYSMGNDYVLQIDENKFIIDLEARLPSW